MRILLILGMLLLTGCQGQINIFCTVTVVPVNKFQMSEGDSVMASETSLKDIVNAPKNEPDVNLSP